MNIEISSRGFSAVVETQGAELRSFRREFDGDDMIWQRTGGIWEGSAPILFPVIGRMKNGSYFLNGREWKMPKHGLVCKQEWTIVRRDPERVVLRTVDNQETCEHYPFHYRFDATFSISRGSLSVSYAITNTGKEPMLFSVGSHPGISLPMEGTSLEDYTIRFNRPEQGEVRRLTPAGLLSAKPERVMAGADRIPLTHDIFVDDALFLTNIASDVITIGNDKIGRYVEVKTGGAPDLGLWAKPGAPYVCVEPWFGHDDLEDHDGNLENKRGILRLQSGAVFKTGYALRWRGASAKRTRPR